MKRPLTLVFSGFLILTPVQGQDRTPSNPAFQAVEDVPGLPRVLILGDSISIGYTLALREELESVANVHRPAENCRSTAYGLEKIDQWLGEGDWDLIHFNWGLHDLKYVDEEGRLKKPPVGRQVASTDQYAANLEKLVKRLRQTGAVLIWRPTTPVPTGAAGRFSEDVAIYNARARAIMDHYGVQANDLNALILSAELPHTRPDNVHFTPESSRALAVEIAPGDQEGAPGPAGQRPRLSK